MASEKKIKIKKSAMISPGLMALSQPQILFTHQSIVLLDCLLPYLYAALLAYLLF